MSKRITSNGKFPQISTENEIFLACCNGQVIFWTWNLQMGKKEWKKIHPLLSSLIFHFFYIYFKQTSYQFSRYLSLHPACIVLTEKRKLMIFERYSYNNGRSELNSVAHQKLKIIFSALFTIYLSYTILFTSPLTLELSSFQA